MIGPARIFAAFLSSLLCSPSAIARQDCEPHWEGGFGQPGTDGVVYAEVVFDDGSAPALYAAGSFATAGGASASRIARWDGSDWSRLGSGIGAAPSSSVFSLAIWDDGSGSALFAGGSFSTAGGVSAGNISKWDGSAWLALGTGTNGSVSAMAAFDDGSGPALYAAGSFTTAGGQSANRIAKWDGSEWSPLGTGLGDSVLALAVFDDGSGPALYAGGKFTTAGGASANRVAKWDGTSWAPVGSGTNNWVYAMAVFDDGEGPALYAGGVFTTAGGASANRIARWDGSGWSPLGSGLNGQVSALARHTDALGEVLLVGGVFTTAGGASANRVAAWRSQSWAPLGSGVIGPVNSLALFDANGTDSKLYAAGQFTTAGDANANNIAQWDGSSWAALGRGMDGWVSVLNVVDDSSGPALVAGGAFSCAGGVTANAIAKWTGSDWSGFGTGLSGSFGPDTYAVSRFDDGSGPTLVVGGLFSAAGGVPANGVATWDGSTWSALGDGVGGAEARSVFCQVVFDDGSGSAVYFGGDFTTAGGLPANYIARWDGIHWSEIGGGMAGGTLIGVLDLEVFDDGGGAALYAGGRFTRAGGISANFIAKWDGSRWSPVGIGMNNWVYAMAVYDDGSGPALCAAGSFTTAGGIAANRIAKWNGSEWSPLSSGLNSDAYALTVFDDGTGPALYAGGAFTSAGGVLASRIAKWDGVSWTAMGSGIGDTLSTVYTLTGVDDGTDPALFVGGDFTMAGGLPSSFIAKWVGCSRNSCAGDLNFDNTVNLSDLGILLSSFDLCPGDAGYDEAAGTLADDDNECVNLGDLGVVLANWGQLCE